jgi:hypothetical protein
MGGRVRAAMAAAMAMLGMVALGGDAAAQGTARSLDLDTSVRSLGRGGASVAVFWDGGSEWVNPSLLGYRNGLSFTWDRHELVPGVADGVVLSSRRLSLGLWGVGFSTSGQPVDVIGGTDLDYGAQYMTDASGNFIGTWHSYEHIRSWSLGLSAATLFDHAAALLGNAMRLSDWADVAVGGSWKRVGVALDPPQTFSTDATDIGLLVRLSPLDTRRGAGAGGGVTHRVDLSYGQVVLNSNDPTIDFGIYGGAVPTSRLERNGGAIGWTVRLSPEDLRRDARLRRIAGPDGAMLRVVAARDGEHVSAGQNEAYAYDVDRWGTEITFGRVAALRTGHVSDREGDIQGFSWGFGLGAPLGPVGEVSYDFSSTPQAEGLDSRHSHSVTLRVDVLATLKSWREEGSHANAN